MSALCVTQFNGWRQGWTKPDRRPIYTWAHEHLLLPQSYSIPGRFDISLTRPLQAVFDDIQNPNIRRIRFRKPPRFGGSMVADIAIPWIVCNDPGPVMWNWQSDDDAKGHMKEKALALWKSCKPFKAMLPENRHDKTTTEIYFGPFFVVAQGANLNNLQSKGVRWMFNDELWLPVWQDLYQHAVYRTRDYERVGNDKIIDVSQAGTKDDVEDRNWQTGHRAVWGYKGTDNKLHPLLFGGKRDDGSRWGLIWNDDAKRDGKWNKQRAVETCRYEAKETGQIWKDDPKTIAEWNREGDYIATNPNASTSNHSYSVNALLNRTFASLIEEKIDAMELASRGNMAGMKDYKQKAETVPWEELNLTIELTVKGGGYTYSEFANGEPWEGEVRRTMMIDRQHGRAGDVPHRWVEIRAWRPDGSSRQLYFGRLNTKEACREMQRKYNVKDRSTWQDSAFEQDLVLKECIEYGWMAVRGSPTHNATWTHEEKDAKGEVVKVRKPFSPIQLAGAAGQQAPYMLFNQDYISDILANLLAGRGVPHDHPSDVNPVYLEHLKGKHKIEKRPGVFTWEKIDSHADDHGFDTSKMGVLYAVVMKLLAMPKEGKT